MLRSTLSLSSIYLITYRNISQHVFDFNEFGHCEVPTPGLQVQGSGPLQQLQSV